MTVINELQMYAYYDIKFSGTVELFDARKLVKDFKIRPGMTTWKVSALIL
jgi:hypothetical protein